MDLSKSINAMGKGKNNNNSKDTINGSFDPSALERGAKALKEMDSSNNASKAFEITKQQEITKQKEFQADMEKQQTQRMQMSMQMKQVEGEEKRKTMAHQEEQERRTAQYKTQLESELYQHKLEDQQKQNEAWLNQQHQNFLRQEDIRKKTDAEIEQMKMRNMAEQARLDRETEVVLSSWILPFRSEPCRLIA